MKQELLRHLGALGGYFLVVSLLRMVRFGFQLDSGLLWLWLGGMTGYLLVFLDRLVYVYLIHPQEQLSQQVQYLIAKRDVWAALEAIHRRRREQTRLAFRSLLFVMAWVLLALFALTSTGDLFAASLVMALGLHLVYDFWRDQQANPQLLNQKLFWQIKRQVSFREQRVFLYSLSVSFVVLSLLLIQIAG